MYRRNHLQAWDIRLTGAGALVVGMDAPGSFLADPGGPVMGAAGVQATTSRGGQRADSKECRADLYSMRSSASLRTSPGLFGERSGEDDAAAVGGGSWLASAITVVGSRMSHTFLKADTV
jgi:hypothetical protein